MKIWIRLLQTVGNISFSVNVNRFSCSCNMHHILVLISSITYSLGRSPLTYMTLPDLYTTSLWDCVTCSNLVGKGVFLWCGVGKGWRVCEKLTVMWSCVEAWIEFTLSRGSFLRSCEFCSDYSLEACWVHYFCTGCNVQWKLFPGLILCYWCISVYAGTSLSCAGI